MAPLRRSRSARNGAASGGVSDGDTPRDGDAERLHVGDDLPVEAASLAETIIERLSAPYRVTDHSLFVGASVGIALAPSDGEDADTLLKNADLALHRAKADGRGRHRFFEAEMDARMRERRVLELDLRAALANGEFGLHYQPIVDLARNAVCAFEMLLRWHHPTRGTVPPAAFIPLAEEIGIIGAVGACVLATACREAATWPADVTVAVNLSPLQFKTRTLAMDVLAAVGAAGLVPRRLELEITETVLLDSSPATLETLHSLRAFGVRIAMDDFGTGYSSLSYLRAFPFDKIKIDQSFIRHIADDAGSLAIVRAILGLGAGLGIATTAEGVETGEQLACPRAEGCTQVQGFLFSRPLPARRVAQMLGCADRHAA